MGVLTNWKTTTAGLAAILTGLMGILHAVNPEVMGPDLSTAFASIVAGFGLVFAKDSNH